MSSDDDPLAGADIGETRHVVDEKTLHGVDMMPYWDIGRDREGDADITAVEIVENDDGYNDIRVTFEGEVTKHLPPNWDRCNEPRTEEERRQQRRKERLQTWGSRVARALAMILPLGLGVVITDRVMREFAGEPSTFGPVQPPSTLEIVTIFAFIVGFAWFLMWAANGGIPPMLGGSRHGR